MSPLPDELRSTLRDRADSVPAPPDLFDAVEARATRLRRRRAAVVAAAGTVTVVVAVAIAVALVGGDSTRIKVGEQANTPSATPSPGSEVYITPPDDPNKPVNLLGWPARADAAAEMGGATWNNVDRALLAGTLLWSGSHDQQRVGNRALWSALLPTGDRAVAFQVWDARTAFDASTVVVVVPKRYEGVLAPTDQVGLFDDNYTWFNDQKPGEPVSATKDEANRIAAISTVVSSNGTDYVVVLAKHADDTVRYAADGSTFADEPAADGVAVFERPAGAAGDRVEVRDAAGQVTYLGPVVSGN